MTQDELTQFLSTLPSDFLVYVEKYTQNKLSQEKLIFMAEKYLDKTKFETFMSDVLNLKKIGPNHYTDNPSRLETHNTLMNIAFAITSLVGGMAVKDAINKNNDSSNSLPETESKSDSSVISDSPVSDSLWSNLLSGFNKFLTGASESFSSIGKNFFQGLETLGSTWLSQKWDMSNMKELIDYQNQYNTPANQMQRFADAGLNPNLIYGLGSNGNQPASGSIAPVDFATHQRENKLANMQLTLQSKQVMADIAQKQAMVNLYNKQAEGVELENSFNAQTLNERVLQVSQTVSQLANQLELQTKEINSWDEYRQAQLDLMEAQMYAAYLSGHSIFGKVTVELQEIAKRLKERYPRFYEEWEKFQKGMSDGVGFYLPN